MERTVQIQLVSFVSDNSVLSTFQFDLDLVDHACMLHKLEHLGVRGKDLDWSRNYLTTRSHRVKYGNILITFGLWYTTWYVAWTLTLRFVHKRSTSVYSKLLH